MHKHEAMLNDVIDAIDEWNEIMLNRIETYHLLKHLRNRAAHAVGRPKRKE